MLDPNTPAGTKVLCVDTRGCFCTCACAGGHDLGPLKERRIYAVKEVSPNRRASHGPLAGYAVRLEGIESSAYAPDRFVPLEPRWQATRRVDRAPVRSKKLEEA